MASNMAGSLDAGPKVATILVARVGMSNDLRCNLISIFTRNRLHNDNKLSVIRLATHFI